MLAACGPSYGPAQGKITDKIAPKGSFQCTGVLANSCGNDDNYKIVIEDSNPKHDLEGNYMVSYAPVCVAPSVFKRVKIGQWYVTTKNDDLWCNY